jgi:hypothetical protein
MKYTINNATQMLDEQGNPKTDNYGNHSFKVFAKDEDGNIYDFFKNVKPGNQVRNGDILEGTVTQEVSKAGNKYWKFTSAPKEFGGKTWKPVDESSKYPSFAFSYAKDIHVACITAGHEVSGDIIGDIEKDAKRILSILKSLSNTSEAPAIALQPKLPLTDDSEQKRPDDEIDIDSIPF